MENAIESCQAIPGRGLGRRGAGPNQMFPKKRKEWRVGDPSDEPLLLVTGLSEQMLHWPNDLLAVVADRGFAVARFDNRDTGLSTQFSTAGVPTCSHG